jgi:hypothetical protein
MGRVAAHPIAARKDLGLNFGVGNFLVGEIFSGIPIFSGIARLWWPRVDTEGMR